MASPIAFGYLRHSYDRKVGSMEAQRQVVEDYCRTAGLGEPRMYGDAAVAGRLPLFDRPAGRRLFQDLRSGDHVVTVQMDVLADSFDEFVFALDSFFRRGITTHLMDLPGGRLDAGNERVRLLIENLAWLNQEGRRMAGVRVQEALAAMKGKGWRCSRHPPYGYRWLKRGARTYAVPEPDEQVILRRVGELYVQGYPIDDIRMYLAGTWGVRNRNQRPFGYGEVKRMAIRGAELLATARAELVATTESDSGTTQPVATGNS